MRNHLDDDTKVVHEDANILAIKIPKLSLLIIGVYLTCYHDTSSKEQYTSQLNSLTALIEMNIDENDIVIAGDFQAFPSDIYDSTPRNNPKRNPLSPILRDFIEENELQLIDITNGTGPTQTYEHKTLKNSSYVDHVATLRNTNLSRSRCTIHPKTANNMSDHQPITFTISTAHANQESTPAKTKQSSPYDIPKFAWTDPKFIENYQHEVNTRLSEERTAGETTELQVNSINKILVDSSNAAFITTFPERKAHPHSKEWWNPEVSRAKSILSTHFNTWRDASFPKEEDNVVFNRYKLARTNFRKAIKSAQNRLVFEKYRKIDHLKNTESRKFWKNMRKLKGNNLKRSFTINGKKTDEDITREFADHFKTLMNNPRGSAKSQYDPLPTTSNEVFIVNSADVHDAIVSLKTNKSKDYFSVLAEHFIYANNDQLTARLAFLYSDIFAEQGSPSSLSMALLLPFVKSYKKSLSSPNNYRGISLIPILTKILEYVILKKCPALSVSDLSQFGFKTASSTLHAEYLINETVNYYNKNGSAVYMCSLDAEKAFDSCNWTILFEKLFYEKGIPLPVINFLKSLYINGTYQVLYNGHLSYEFNASQGVFQGSILSPHLYNIYTEELLKQIRMSANGGTSIGETYTGIVAYADDVILMSSTISGLQKLLDTCVEYYNDASITLNVEKTEFLASGHSPNDAYIDLYHHHIQPQNRLKHLGFIWNKVRDKGTLNGFNIQERINKFWAVIFALIKGGIRFSQPGTIVELYKTLAIPTLTYGLEIPHLTETQLDTLDKEGRKALKQLFNISKHSKNYLHSLFNIDHISTTIKNNKLKLLSRLMANEHTQNVVLSTLQSTSLKSTAQDCFHMAIQHNINPYDILLNINNVRIQTTQNIVPEREEIENCFIFWNVAERRQRFRTIMEQKIIRPTVA